MKKQITKEEALGKLESLCSRSEQCEYDLMQKLYRWGLPAQQRSEIIESLKENRFLDNGRYAKSYAHDKARFSAWGPMKIRMELIKKRISSQLISEALRGIDQEIWREGIFKNARAKAKSLDLKGENSFQEKQKLIRYLVGRGYPVAAAVKAAKALEERG